MMSVWVSGKELEYTISSCKEERRGKKKRFCCIIRIAKVTMKAPTVEYWDLFENIMVDSTLWQEQREGTPVSPAPLCLERKQYLLLQICKCRCFLYFLSTSEIKMGGKKKGSPSVSAALNCASLSRYEFRYFLRAPLLSSLSFCNGKVLSLAAWTLPSAARCRCQSDSLWEHFIIP